MSPPDPSGVKPFERRFNAQRQEYQNRLQLTEKVQADLAEDVDALRAQEGWDLETQRGTEEWLADKDNVFHALRRNRWDTHKVHAFLLAALHQRVTRKLHEPIHTFPEYSNSTLFHILPLPTFTDRVQRPIAVITLNQVHRDEHGHLDDLKEWTWWAMEMVRRTLRDWWLRGEWIEGKADPKGKKVKRGTGGEGIVVIVDATKAGYRNLEVDLLPTLLACGHNNFPGMMEAVYIVNAGWTHRSMWGIIKRLLPKTTLEKVNFLENKKMLEEIFDLDRLPQTLGGNHPYTFDPTANPMLQHYSLRSSKTSNGTSTSISRSASCSSIADVYFSAPNSPFHSRAPSRLSSRRGSLSNGLFNNSLRMTQGAASAASGSGAAGGASASGLPRRTKSDAELHRRDNGDGEEGEEREEEIVKSPFEEEFGKATASGSGSGGAGGRSRKSSTGSTPRETPIQRIKSLSNFHLYLSPSRLAHIDLLNDSDSDGDTDDEGVGVADAAKSAVVPQRKTLAPAVVDPDATVRNIASRRSRPPLRLLGGAANEAAGEARSYSDNLGLHHAKLLQQYRSAAAATSAVHDEVPPIPPRPTHTASNDDEGDGMRDLPSASSAPALDAGQEEVDVDAPLDQSTTRDISAYSRSTNPWFGYPAVLIPDTSPGGHGILVPRYSRRRKRDLVKTLLFLFMIRLQTLRDSFERSLGLNRVGSWSLLREGRERRMGSVTPGEGLVMAAGGSRGTIKRRTGWVRDWAWWIVGFLILRGTWVRLLAAPLELLGLESIRDLLGLV